jgi:hypothetical protein
MHAFGQPLDVNRFFGGQPFGHAINQDDPFISSMPQVVSDFPRIPPAHSYREPGPVFQIGGPVAIPKIDGLHRGQIAHREQQANHWAAVAQRQSNDNQALLMLEHEEALHRQLMLNDIDRDENPEEQRERDARQQQIAALHIHRIQNEARWCYGPLVCEFPRVE